MTLLGIAAASAMAAGSVAGPNAISVRNCWPTIWSRSQRVKRARLWAVLKCSEVRRDEDIAEVRGHGGEPALPPRLRRERQAARTAQVGGDDLRVRLVDEEAGAIEELHQRAGAGDAALREEHELAAGLEELRHVLHGVRGGVVDGERP